jgi:hypothetical protein
MLADEGDLQPESPGGQQHENKIPIAGVRRTNEDKFPAFGDIAGDIPTSQLRYQTRKRVCESARSGPLVGDFGRVQCAPRYIRFD